MIAENHTIIELEPLDSFVETSYVSNIVYKAIHYIKAGFAVHFRGPAGTGKTTIAKHLARLIGNPLVILHGDEQLTTSDLIGGEYGFQAKTMVDNYISSVVKREHNVTKQWVDNRLTVACRHGFTMIYDEFTRSRPETNTVFLPILEERMLNIPISRGDGNPYIQVHPDFVAVFTSNPEEYAGVHKTQDALRDRMITIDLDYFDYETEVAITKAKSRASHEEATLVVTIVRALRDSGECEFSPTVRACIMLAKTMKIMNLSPIENVDMFVNISQDILASETSRVGGISKHLHTIKELVREIILYQVKFFGKQASA